MQPRGGLKLKLDGARRDDREVRFARVGVVCPEASEEIALVTDSSGRLRYRLPGGEYLLRVGDGPETVFRVEPGRWTLVRLRVR